MGDVLRVSERMALGLHAMVLLAESEVPVSSGTIAGSLRASRAHLSKVLERLAGAGLVESRRGARGGYRLARPANAVFLLEIYEALEGTPRRDGCLFASPVCSGRGCFLGTQIERARENVIGALRTTTLAQAVKRQRRP